MAETSGLRARNSTSAGEGAPGPAPSPVTGDQSAALVHDWTNVVVLSVISVVALWSLQQGEESQGHLAVVVVTSIYLVLDVVWILLQPGMVKAPLSIVAHHVVTLIVLADPAVVPEHRANASRALVVEINTVLLTVRRLLGRPLWAEIGFFSTWLLIRLIWFPLLGASFIASTAGKAPELDAALAPFFSGPILGLLRPPKVLKPIWLSASGSFAAVVLLQFHWTFSLGKGMLFGKASEKLNSAESGSAQPGKPKSR